MTTNDDSNLQVVERDLRALAEPRSGDDLIRLAVREQLAAKLCPRPRRRLSLRIVFRSATVAAAAAALAVVALVATNGTGGTSSADAAIIHHVLREVSPPAHKILHVEVVGMQNGMTVIGETWEQTSPPYAFRGLKGAVGQQGEFAVNGTTSFSYDPRTNTIYASPSSSPPTFADPLLQVRQELARGQAQDVGTAMIGGTPLYKINLPHGLVGYFDESNYLPRYLDDPQSDGTVLRLRVAAYEYLPMTRANRALLSIAAQHPGARLDTSRSAGVATK
jgi:hypothetical protein